MEMDLDEEGSCTSLLLKEMEGVEEAIVGMQRALEGFINKREGGGSFLLPLLSKGVELVSLIPEVREELHLLTEEKEKHQLLLFSPTPPPSSQLSKTLLIPEVVIKEEEKSGDEYEEEGEEEEIKMIPDDDYGHNEDEDNAEAEGKSKGLLTPLLPMIIKGEGMGLLDTSPSQSSAEEDEEELQGNIVLPFPCHQCEKSFPSDKLLVGHLLVHQERRYVCTQCPASFHHQFRLNRHVKAVHEKEKRFKCELCDAAFAWTPAFRRHQKKVHGIGDMFECSHCGKGFAEKHVLDRHVLTVHENLRPYPCLHCPKTFKQRSELTTHIRKKHPADNNFLED